MPVTGGVTKTLSVVVDTGAPLGAGPEARLSRQPRQPSPTSPLVCLLPAALLLGLLARRRLPLKLLVLLIGAAAMASLSGCASSFQQGQTPAGSFAFQIVATGAQSGATGTATVQLTVTQ
jgi:CHASE2 domain-containing sensor protein